MFQDLNGNNQDIAVMFSNGNLPCIYEDNYLEDVGVVPSYGHVNNVSLECQEDIDWDDIDMKDKHLFLKSTNHIGHIKGHVKETLIEDDSMNMYDDDPVPFTEIDYAKTEMPQNTYASSLLHIWRESSFEIADSSAESTQVNLSQAESEGFSLKSEEDTCSSSSISDIDIYEYEGDNQVFEEISNVQNDTGSSNGELQTMRSFSFDMPEIIYNNNNITNSQTFNLGPNDAGQGRNYFMSLRSVSPELARSLSPISSRSSSPRFLRSPSPLEFLQQSFAALPLNNSQDAMFYEDRFLVRTVSPGPVTDHEVPDVDFEYRAAIEQSDEFPSFRRYQSSRTLRSCFDDQVVPEFIEE